MLALARAAVRVDRVGVAAATEAMEEGLASGVAGRERKMGEDVVRVFERREPPWRRCVVA
jgi:hypothetical protein